jgi:hypothetical protein
MAGYEVARLDEDGTLVAIDACGITEYVTDPLKRTVRLDSNHDMRNRIGNYRYDWLKQTFMPLSQEPLDVAERDTSEIVEGLIEAIEDITQHLKANQPQRRTLGGSHVETNEFQLSPRMNRVIRDYRRVRPRRSLGTSE